MSRLLVSPLTRPEKKNKTTTILTAVNKDADQNNKPKKLSYKDQRELDLLPGKIESLENEQQQLQAQISDSSFYQQQQETIKQTLYKLEHVNAELEQCYARWEELE